MADRITSDRGAVPLRMSVDDVDFDPRIGARLLIFLDGVEQKEAAAYDVEAGTVTRLKRGDDGEPVIEADEFVRETVTGKVEVSICRD